MTNEISKLVLRGALFVINHSGGKDSQAMHSKLIALVPKEQLLVIHAVLPEVDWEGTEQHVIDNIGDVSYKSVVAVKTFFEMVSKRGMFPSPKYRQCTSDLKRSPIEKCIRHYLKANPQFNGLVTCDQTFGKISVRHNSNAPMKVVDGSHEIITQAPKLIQNVETMQAIQLTRPEQEIFANTVLDFILPEDTDTSKMVTSRDNLINQSLRTYRTSDQDDSLWSTFNKLQERVLKGGLRMQKMTDKGYKRSTTRAVNAIDKNIKLNKALWSMAEQMKELKG